MSEHELTTGGSNAMLPDNWVTPNGYPLTKTMMWIGEKPCTDEDIAALKQKGFDDYEQSTLVGILDPDWDARQYINQDTTDVHPWQTLPRYGGKYSAAYKFQHLPEGVKIAHPRWWILKLDGTMVRAKGGEPIESIDLAQGFTRLQEVDLEVSWDADLGVWRT